MSSVLKRLREVAEMRAAGIDDRAQYRYAKDLASDPERARRHFRVSKFAPPEQKGRSSRALAELGDGVTVRSLARALKVFFS